MTVLLRWFTTYNTLTIYILSKAAMLSWNEKLVGDAESFVSFIGLDADATIGDILKKQYLDLCEFDEDERVT